MFRCGLKPRNTQSNEASERGQWGIAIGKDNFFYLLEMPHSS